MAATDGISLGADMTVTDGSNIRTIAFWAQPNSLSDSNKMILSVGGAGGANGYGMMFLQNSGSLWVEVSP